MGRKRRPPQGRGGGEGATRRDRHLTRPRGWGRRRLPLRYRTQKALGRKGRGRETARDQARGRRGVRRGEGSPVRNLRRRRPQTLPLLPTTAAALPGAAPGSQPASVPLSRSPGVGASPPGPELYGSDVGAGAAGAEDAGEVSGSPRRAGWGRGRAQRCRPETAPRGRPSSAIWAGVPLTHCDIAAVGAYLRGSLPGAGCRGGGARAAAEAASQACPGWAASRAGE